MFIHLRPWPCNFALLGHNGSVYYESALERRFDVWFPLLDLHPGGRYILLFCVDSLLLNLRTFHGVVASPWYLAVLSELITSTLSLFLFPPSNVFSPYWIVASTLDRWESTKTIPSHISFLGLFSSSETRGILGFNPSPQGTTWIWEINPFQLCLHSTILLKGKK